jgi:hypothetical protein
MHSLKVSKNEYEKEKILKSLVPNKLKDINCLFFHKRGLIFRFFGKKVHKLYRILIRTRHRFYVLKVKRILHLSAINVYVRTIVHPYTIGHVRMRRRKPVTDRVVVSRVVAVSVVAHYVVAVT